MDWRLDLAALVMFGCGAVMLGLIGYVWPRRTAGAVALVAMLAALAGWSIAYGFELSASGLPAKEFFGAVKYVGICALAPAWIAFTLHYIDRARYFTRRVLGLLMIEPVVVMVLLAVPQTHDLVRYYPADAAGQEHPVVSVGWFFWVHLGYTNVLLLGATGVFAVSLARVSRVYWREAVALIAATLLPWVVNLMHNLDIAGSGRVDLTPVAFAVTATVIVWGVFRRRLLGLSAVGRHAVVETMRDGMVVIDAYHRIVDLNRAAGRILGRSNDRLIGLDVADVLPDATASAHDAQTDAATALAADVDGVRRDYEVTRSVLTDSRGRHTGALLLLRDVTERRRAERQMFAILAEQSRIARVLQDGLLPSALPDVPGLDLATRYRPAADDGDIGGDFYDVFPLAGDRWAVVLGDVSGKGVEAAATTALARYTVRALAAEPHTPCQMLARLNAAMLGQSADERFCTAVYLVVEPHAQGARVQLSLGGHPPPVLARAGRPPEYVGRPGLVLGVFDQPELHDVEVDLGVGDVMCLYTDGVTEARRGRELLGDERLVQAVGISADQPSDQVAGNLEQYVADFCDTGHRDDLAIVVIRPTGCGARPGGREVTQKTMPAASTITAQPRRVAT